MKNLTIKIMIIIIQFVLLVIQLLTNNGYICIPIIMLMGLTLAIPQDKNERKE